MKEEIMKLFFTVLALSLTPTLLHARDLHMKCHSNEKQYLPFYKVEVTELDSRSESPFLVEIKEQISGFAGMINNEYKLNAVGTPDEQGNLRIRFQNGSLKASDVEDRSIRGSLDFSGVSDIQLVCIQD